MMFSCVFILEVMVVLGFPPLEMMQCLIPPLELVHGGVQGLVVVELIMMAMWDEGQ